MLFNKVCNSHSEERISVWVDSNVLLFLGQYFKFYTCRNMISFPTSSLSRQTRHTSDNFPKCVPRRNRGQQDTALAWHHLHNTWFSTVDIHIVVSVSLYFQI